MAWQNARISISRRQWYEIVQLHRLPEIEDNEQRCWADAENRYSIRSSNYSRLCNLYQAIITNRDELGLKEAALRNAYLNYWFKRLRATVFLTPSIVDHLLQNLLNAQLNLPPQLQPAFRQFCEYYKNTWKDGALRPYWSQYLNDGPMTTNHIEGWHGSVFRV